TSKMASDLSTRPRFKGYSGVDEAVVVELTAVPPISEIRMSSGLSELDRVLGGGIVLGSAILMGGDPGIGKSTVLLQTLANLSKALYVTGEESLQQVKLRAERLGVATQRLNLLAETEVERILEIAAQEKPRIMVVDSI